MNNVKDIKNKITDLYKQIKSAENELAKQFDIELEKLFASKVNAVEGHTLDAIRIYVNNHEFNDGDATYYSLNYQDMTLVFTDSIGNEIEADGYGEETAKFKSIRKEFVELFSLFDVKDFYENKFKDSYESLNFSLSKSGKLEIS